MYKNYIDTALTSQIIGLESLSGFIEQNSSNHDAILKKAFGSFGAEATSKIGSMLKKYIPKVNSSGHLTNDMRVKMYTTDISEGISAAAKEYATQTNRFQMLPQEVQSSLKHLYNNKTRLDNEVAKNAGNRSDRAVAAYKAERATMALENALFTVFSGVMEPTTRGIYGVESYSYQNAIVYPKLEVPVQWVAACSTIYNKVMKIKQLYNKYTSIPIHTKKPYYIVTNPETNEIEAEIPREYVLNYIDPTKYDKAGSPLEGVSKLFQDLTRRVVIKKDHFRTRLNLRKDRLFKADASGVLTTEARTATTAAAAAALTGTPNPHATFITANELVRSDWYVSGITAGGKTTGRIYDVRAGRMLSETVNEQDYKGKNLQVLLDPTKPNEKYWLMIEFVGQDQTLMITCDKDVDNTTGPDVDSITIDFKLLDPYNMFKSVPEYTLKEERGFLNAGPEVKEYLSVAADQLDILNERLGGNYFSQLINLATEKIAHRKDRLFFMEYDAVKNQMHKDFRTLPDIERQFLLYSRQSVNLQIDTSVNKLESYSLQLGAGLAALKNRYRINAQSQKDPTINMFASSYALGVFNGSVTAVVGEVGEVDDGKFLGVNSPATVKILTLGTSTDAPISALVVGTDKRDRYPVTTDRDGNRLAPQDIQYQFDIMPWFDDPNLGTHIFTETATRVVSDPGYRNPSHPNIPSMQMEYTAAFNTIRAAQGELIVSGWIADLVGQ